jgi:hypothetical protein
MSEEADHAALRALADRRSVWVRSLQSVRLPDSSNPRSLLSVILKSEILCPEVLCSAFPLTA